MRWFSISSSRKFTNVGSASSTARFSPSSFSSVEKYGEKKNTDSSRFCSSASANSASSSRDAVELAVLLRDLEQRVASRPGRSPPRATSPRRLCAPSAVKSSSPSASCTSRRWSSRGQRLARHLLGREDRQVGDLVADLLDRAPGLGLDVAAGLLEQLLPLAASGLERLALVLLGRRGASARRSPRPAGAPPAGARGTRAAACRPRPCARSDASIDSSIAFWRLSSASWMRGNAYFAEDPQRHAEGDQRPQHQPELGRDEEVASLVRRGVPRRLGLGQHERCDVALSI